MQKQVTTKIGVKEWDMIGKAMYPKNSIIIVHIFAVVCVVMLLRSYQHGNTAMAAYYLLLGIVLEGFTHLARHNRLKANRRFFTEQYGDKQLELVYTFDDDGFNIVNQLTGDRSEYKYDTLASYKETDEYLLIRGKDRQYFIIGKAEADEAGLIDFLQSKAPELQCDSKKQKNILL